MAKRLDKHYSDLGGVNTSSNRMSQDPKTARSGSINFQYSDGVTSDEIAKRKGFQHKSVSTYAAECGLIEYKFKNIDTGEDQTIILGVGKDGQLRKKIEIGIRLTKASGSADNYSFFYDGTNWRFQIRDNTNVLICNITVTISTTLDSLLTSINALAISGLTAAVVDENNTVVSSTLLAYLMDTVINVTIPTGSVSNFVFDWQLVPHAMLSWNNTLPAVIDNVPFPNARDGFLNESWKGVSYTNLNNLCYITDGGFIMKYDGYQVCRAGMPRTTRELGYDLNNNLTVSTTGAMTSSTTYKYIIQTGHRDVNGVTVLGLISEDSFFEAIMGVSDQGAFLDLPVIANYSQTRASTNAHFPIYSARINLDQTISGTGSKTVNVLAGHNIKVGMCIRVPIMNNSNAVPSTLLGWSFAYYEVTAITATTIQFNKTISNHVLPSSTTTGRTSAFVLNNTSTNTNLFKNDLVLQGCYVPVSIKGTATEVDNLDPDSSTPDFYAWCPNEIYGAFARVWRTVANGSEFYQLADFPIRHDVDLSIPSIVIKDELADTLVTFNYNGGLSRLPVDFFAGEELPRACGFISQFQQQILQGGRPYKPSNFINDIYPWYFGIVPTAGDKWGFPLAFALFTYQENNLCDFQSVYWADSIAFEGFPQSGANEESFESALADKINGAMESKEALFVFKDRTMGVLSGTLATGDITKEILESDVGCANQSSLAQVNGAVMFLDPIKGFHLIVAGRLPIAIGQPIMDQFKANGTKAPLFKLNLNRAQAADFKSDDKYICYIPAAIGFGTNFYPTSSSLMFVFDYSIKDLSKGRNCWYFWNSTNNAVNGCGGVLASADGNFYLGGLTVDATQIIWKQKFTESVYDYADHINPINMVFNQSWLTYGERSIDKHWIQAAINSIVGGFTLTVKQYVDWVETAIGSIDVAFSSSPSKVKPKQTVKINQPKASAFSIGFENNIINQDVRIDGYELEWSADFDPTEVKK
jgi:hypothetical protein